MTAVLAGSSVQALRIFLSQTASREQLYFLNPSGMCSYVQRLRNDLGPAEEAMPLQWVERMTVVERHRRCSAAELLEAILIENRFSSFIRDCCQMYNKVNPENDSRSIYIKDIKHEFDEELADNRSNEVPKSSVLKDASPFSAHQSNTRTGNGITAATETSSTIPRIRIIVPEGTRRASRQNSDSLPKAPFRLNEVVAQMIESIPWGEFFSYQDLPKADNGVVGVPDMDVRFIDPATVTKVSSVLSAHYSRTENNSEMERSLKNPILKMTKICCILHLIDRHDLLGYLTEARITDVNLPLTSSTLSTVSKFTEDEIESFIDSQYTTQVRDLDPKEDVTHFEEYELLPFERISPLGAGGWGVVDKVKNVFTPGKILARKSFSISGSDQKDLEETFKREIEAMKKLSGHQHIIEFQAAYQTPKVLALLLSPVATCDLHRYLRNWKQLPKWKNRKEEIFGRVFGCLPAALNFIHQHGSKFSPLESFICTNGLHSSVQGCEARQHPLGRKWSIREAALHRFRHLL